MSQTVLTRIKARRLVAVVRLANLDCAVDLTKALLLGGVDVVEFTLTSPGVLKAITVMGAEMGDQCLIGAGSVTTPSQVDAVADAGAAFAVSPVTNEAMVSRCKDRNLPTMIGAYTPTEIQRAWDMGAAIVKLFPARNLGPSYVKDVLAPLPHLQIMPTGSINKDNAADYVRSGAVAVGVGGSLIDQQCVINGDWDTITRRAQSLVDAIVDLRTS